MSCLRWRGATVRWRPARRRALLHGRMHAIPGLPSPARWRATWRALGAGSSDAPLYDELIARYQAPPRHYHTTQHLAEMFELWPGLAHLARHAAEVELAIWFHDAVYDPAAGDNEARSARWARTALEAAGCDPDAARRVHDLVLATKHDAEPSDDDARILVDLDLAILGAPPDRFDEYEHQIRAEYAMVPVEAFRQGRRAILATFLAREHIFHTTPMRTAREQRARTNLARSIEALSR